MKNLFFQLVFVAMVTYYFLFISLSIICLLITQQIFIQVIKMAK